MRSTRGYAACVNRRTMRSVTAAVSMSTATSIFGRLSGFRRRSNTVVPYVSVPSVSTSPYIRSVVNSSGSSAATIATASCR